MMHLDSHYCSMVLYKIVSEGILNMRTTDMSGYYWEYHW